MTTALTPPVTTQKCPCCHGHRGVEYEIAGRCPSGFGDYMVWQTCRFCFGSGRVTRSQAWEWMILSDSEREGYREFDFTD